jgi:formate dehydrogenase iron-sulfur subunit
MTSIRFFIPRDAAAIAVGADGVAAALGKAAQTAGRNIEIVRTGSRGMMWLEPLLEVESNGVRHGFGPLEADDIPGLVAAGLLDGHSIGLTTHPKSVGPVEQIGFFSRQTRLTFARCGVIDPLSLDDYRAHGGYVGLEQALALGGAGIVDVVAKSGLRGRGGAGFPTGIKWKTVHETAADQKYIVCNADEGDSATFADRMIMEGDPFLLIEGMTIAGIAVGATKGYIYVRSEYPHAIATLKEAIGIARKAGLLGANVAASKQAFDLEVRTGAGAYVCGEETALLDSLEGKRGIVRAKPPLPAHKGLFGRPTIINNVLSLVAVPFILSEGAKVYADLGMGRSRGTMPIQLAGNIKYGGLFETAFGMTLGELVDDVGGGTFSGQVGHGGVVVFDDTVDMAAQARFAFEFCAIESCGKCTPCRIGSTRGVETIDKIIAGAEPEEQLALVTDLCNTMKFGSLCALGGFTPYPVMSALTHFPDDFRRAKRLPQAAE